VTSGDSALMAFIELVQRPCDASGQLIEAGELERGTIFVRRIWRALLLKRPEMDLGADCAKRRR
jgi:hypothetical protein